MKKTIVIMIGLMWAWTANLRAQTPLPKGFDLARYMPVSEVRPGMTGYGLSVFSGTKIERFDVKVISILKNFNPKCDVILVRCSGANLEHTGSIAGMSGSPIYLKDAQGRYRMVGAFAYGWPLMKDPVGGVQPIQYMLGIPGPSTRPSSQPTTTTQPGAGQSLGIQTWTPDQTILMPGQKDVPADWPFASWDSTSPNPRLGGVDEPLTRLRPLATPLMTAGLSSQLLSEIGPIFKAYGLTPLQAGGGGGPSTATTAAAEQVKFAPGSVLAVPLLTGDMDLTAIGTCTDVIGDRILGFGHPFNNEGKIDLPMGTGYINGIIASLMTSFKLGALSKVTGTLYRDQTVGVAGEIGRIPPMIPIELQVSYAGGGSQTYRFEAAAHPRLTPMICAAAIAGAINGSHELPQYHTLDYDITMDFGKGQAIHVVNTSANASIQELFYDVGAPIMAAADNPFESVLPTRIEGKVLITPRARLAKILSVNIPKLKYRPGETLDGYVTYRPFRADEAVMPIKMKLPEDLSDGTYQLIVCDWQTYLATEQMAEPFRFTAESIGQVFDVLRDMVSIRHDAIYVRLMRKADGIAIGRTAMAHLPGSLRQVLLGAGRSDITPFLSSDVEVIPAHQVMSGSAQFVITIERNARIETAGTKPGTPAAPAAEPEPSQKPTGFHPMPPAPTPAPKAPGDEG